MPLFDRVKAGATQAVQKAQDAGKAGQAKLDELQAKRHLDGLFRQLGAAVYDEYAGRASATTSADIERLKKDIAAHEAEHGESADEGEGPAASTGEAADGGYKLD